MVQNTSDGKLVEQEGGGEGGKRSSVGGVHVDSDEKMDSLQMEYTYLLTSQVIYPLHCRKRKTDVLCLRSRIGGYMGASSEHRNAIILTLTAVIVHTCLKLTL